MFSFANLSPTISAEIIVNLCAALPPPVIETLEQHEIRNLSAIAAVTALRPANAFEAKLAAEAVACNSYGLDCLRLAGRYRDDFAKSMRCHAQANAMMRAEKQALRLLAKMQAERKVAAVPAPATADASAQPSAAAPPPGQTPTAGDPAPPAPAPQPDALSQAAGWAIEQATIIEKAAAIAQIRRGRGLAPAKTAHIDPAPIPVDARIRDASEALCTPDDIGGERAAAD